MIGGCPRNRIPAAGRPLVCDCIVGGGFTGLWTALEIKERDASVDVTIVEADLCGSGASGRNGGFAMTRMSKAETLRPGSRPADSLPSESADPGRRG